MIEDFYAFFEDINYATETQIRENRSIYIPYTLPLLKHIENPIALDIGCGRGEWLDMMREKGFNTKGVDIDTGMLKHATSKELDVELLDGIDYLYKVPEKSISVLTAFHVLEHIPFNRIIEFFKESQRVLQPGGLLILETPNPENLHVATTNFYLDPTHIRPIPILQMIGLAKFFKFGKYSIIRLQEDKSLYDRHEISFTDLYYGVSKDYAIIAQQPGGSEELITEIDHPMQYTTGISIHELLKRIDQKFMINNEISK